MQPITLSAEQAALTEKWYTLKLQERELKKKLMELEEQLDNLKQTIVKEVFHDVAGTATFNQQLLVHKVIEASRIDTTRLKKEMPNIAKEFTVQYSYSILEVRESLTS